MLGYWIRTGHGLVHIESERLKSHFDDGRSTSVLARLWEASDGLPNTLGASAGGLGEMLL